MHFLIDGHNLIGKMPGLSLSDPHDEVELILRLKGWVSAAANRRLTLYFDGGVVGGSSNPLSSKDIRVIFAPPGKQADDLLIARMKGLKNARQYTLVTSDQRILNAAAGSSIKTLRSEEFVAREGFDYDAMQKAEPTPPPAAPPEKELDPRLSESELKQWLDLFGPVPERKPPPPKRPQRPKPKKKKKKRPGTLATPADRENPTLEDEDLDAWLALFGGEKKEAKLDAARGAQETPKRKKGRPRAKSPKPAADKNPHGLSEEDLKAWNAYFGKDE